jgi:hypothetical protein
MQLMARGPLLSSLLLRRRACVLILLGPHCPFHPTRGPFYPKPSNGFPTGVEE